MLYSGDAAFKLLKAKEAEATELHPSPLDDRHRFLAGAPMWRGTVVGIDINVQQGRKFADLLDDIRKAYSIDVGVRKKAYYKKVRFVR